MSRTPFATLFATLFATALVAALCSVPPTVHADDSSPEQQLAQRWAPIVEVQQQATECGPGEPYLPTTVDSVLGRDDVVLRAADGTVITTAPTAADLYDAPADAHLDMPGDALAPGCDYERWFRKANGERPASVYARVATDPDHADRIVLQYWLFWVFNDWNDKHEGDWEMFQLVFDVPSAEQALGREPIEIAAAQHEGAERRSYDRLHLSEEVRRASDARPVVYPSAGSHATYYSSDRWFGASASSGFGCDDTLGPSTTLQPDVILLPEQVTGPDDPFAWLAWEGRWGERQPAFNNGPTGPNTKQQWTHPITWMEEHGRASSVSLPARGSAVTDFFCSVSRQASLLLIEFLREPLAIALFLVVVLALVAWAVRSNLPILRRASAELRSNRRRFLPISLFVLFSGMVLAAVQSVLLLVPGDETTGVALVLGALGNLAVSVTASASAITLIRDLRNGTAERRGVLRRGLRSPAFRTAAPMGALVVVTAIIPGLSLLLLLAWCVAPSAAAFEDLRMRAALGRSFRLTKRRRWRVALLAGVAILLATATGPLVGTVVLVLSGTSFAVVNLIAGVFGALLVPWLAAVLCALYAELSGDAVAWGRSDR